MASITLNKPSGGAMTITAEDGTSTETVTIPAAGFGSGAPEGISVTKMYTASGTWTKPEGLTAIRVWLKGGGGGGGGVAGSSSSSATGAEAGSSYKYILESALGSTETITIGAGGTGGTGSSDGTTGGTSSFGSHCSATGGAGGWSTSSPYWSGQNTPGVGVGGDVNIHGTYVGTSTEYPMRNFLSSARLTFASNY